MSASEERASFVLAISATLFIHVAFAAGLNAAEQLISKRPPPPAMQVTFEVHPEPPPLPPPPPPVAEAKPPEPPVAAPVPPPRKVASVAKPAPTPANRPVKETPAPPAPGPPDEAPPAPEKVYTLPEGTVALNNVPGGTANGTPGGTGKGPGKGGGASLGTDGTGGPRPVALASVKSLPEPIGEYDYDKDYPDEARKLGIEGQVAVRLLVDETGHVAEAKVAKGLGHGLDGKALELTRKIRFKPAKDDADKAVATWITWTVTFSLPR